MVVYNNFISSLIFFCLVGFSTGVTELNYLAGCDPPYCYLKLYKYAHNQLAAHPPSAATEWKNKEIRKGEEGCEEVKYPYSNPKLRLGQRHSALA